MKISDAMRGVSLLGVETAPFIYYTKSRPGFVDKIRSIFQYLVNGQLSIVTSTITLTETLAKPFQNKDTQLIARYRTMFYQTQGITLLSVNAVIADSAAQLRASYNLRTPDAIHVATAIYAGSDAFLTNDLGMKRVNEIRVLMLDELDLDV